METIIALLISINVQIQENMPIIGMDEICGKAALTAVEQLSQIELPNPGSVGGGEHQVH